MADIAVTARFIPSRTTSSFVTSGSSSTTLSPSSRVLSTLRHSRIVKPPPTSPMAMASVQSYDESLSTKHPVSSSTIPPVPRLPTQDKRASRIPLPVPRKKPPSAAAVVVVPVAVPLPPRPRPSRPQSTKGGQSSQHHQHQQPQQSPQPQQPQQHNRPMLRRKKSNSDLKLVSDLQLSPPHLQQQRQHASRKARGLSIHLPDDIAASMDNSSFVDNSPSFDPHTSFLFEDEPTMMHPRYTSRTPLSEQSATPSLMLSYSTTPSSSSSRYTPPVSQSPNFLGFPSYALAKEDENKRKLYQDYAHASIPKPLTHHEEATPTLPANPTHPMNNAPYYFGSGPVDPNSVLAPIRATITNSKASRTKTSRLALIESTPAKQLKTTHTSVVRPPELAHLDRSVAPSTLQFDSPVKDPNDECKTPPRPSRDGVAGLDDIIPVISDVTTTTHLPLSTNFQVRKRSMSQHKDGLPTDSAGSIRRMAPPLSAYGSITPDDYASPPTPIHVSDKPRLVDVPLQRHAQPMSATSTASSSSSIPALRRVASKFGIFPKIKDESNMVREDATASQATTAPVKVAHRPSAASSSSSSKPRKSSTNLIASHAADILARTMQPVYLRNVNGSIVAGNRSSSNSDHTLASLASSRTSADTSQSSIQAWKIYSDDGSRVSSTRGRGSRGRGSFSGSIYSDTQRRLSKDRKPALPSTSTKGNASPVYRPETEPISHQARYAQPDPASKSKKPGFVSSLFSRGSQTRLKPAPQTHDLTLSQLTAYARPAPKPVAHYLDMDQGPSLSSDDNADIEDLAQIMREASGSGLHTPNDYPIMQSDTSGQHLSHSPQILPSDDLTTAIRPTRLFPVGRIPQVVRRNPDCVPPSNDAMPRLFPTPPSMSSDRLQGTAFPAGAFNDFNNANKENVQAQSADASDKPSFLAMRKNSDQSYSSSSGDFYYPTFPPMSDNLAIGLPTSPDEEWTEYDDYLEVLEDVPSRKSQATLKRPSPSTQSDYFGPRGRASQKITLVDIRRPKTAMPFIGEISAAFKPDLSPFYGTELRRGSFGPLDHPALRPTSTDVVMASAESPDAGNLIRRGSSSSRNLATAAVTTRPKDGRSQQSRMNGSLVELDLAVMDALTSFEDSSLQLAALKVSKWLTFDRVLFSPAHSQYQHGQVEKILVVDGLGKDWPLFCAESYPNAAITGLGPSPQFRSFPRSRPKKFVHHGHQVELGVSFPFARNSFNAVVFRFPRAMDERNLLFAIEECNRMLTPGGHLEVTLIDLDLANMGPRARKAVKQLKIRMQLQDNNVSLKSNSDSVQSMMGKCNFDSINRCTVGVPVAGNITSSSDSSPRLSESSTPDLNGRHEQTDEDMTKLVAKVGRWWYTECYERMAMVEKNEKSIWNDADLLRECKQAETAFKLFVCYAQKPVGERKTRSL